MTTQPPMSQNGPELPGPPRPPLDAPNSYSESPANSRAKPLKAKPFIWVTALMVTMVLGGVMVSANNNAQSTTPPPASASKTTSNTGETTGQTASKTATKTPPATSAPAKKDYQSISSRTFKLLAKDPDSYISKTYVIFGEITQFDAATGTDAFRANTGPQKLRITYGYVDYSQNSVMNGTDSELTKLVEGDCFEAKVTVLGSYSYDTQVGGNTTVPLFQVDSISVYGSTD